MTYYMVLLMFTIYIVAQQIYTYYRFAENKTLQKLKNEKKMFGNLRVLFRFDNMLQTVPTILKEKKKNKSR